MPDEQQTQQQNREQVKNSEKDNYELPKWVLLVNKISKDDKK
jgi:hypothetical protein